MLRDGSIETEASWCGVESEASHAEQCTRLHRRLKRIVKARAALDAQEAEALREAERLRLWRRFGYGSMLEYMEMEMGYTPRLALERLRVANAIVALPAIADALASGELSFSAGRELTRVATPETEGDWLEAATDKNVRKVEDLVSGHKRGDRPTDPVDPALRTSSVWYSDVEEETKVLLAQAQQILERELGERLSDNAFLRIFARMVIDGARAGQRTAAPHQMARTVCTECRRGWVSGAGRTVEMTPPSLETALCDAKHIGSIDSDVSAPSRTIPSEDRATPGNDPAIPSRGPATASKGPTTPRGPATSQGPAPSPKSDADASHSPGQGTQSTTGASPNDRTRRNATCPPGASTSHSCERAKSDIPPALRRKVLHRDRSTCRVPWCRSSRNCDLHHIVPRAEGGQHTEENLITLCESRPSQRSVDYRGHGVEPDVQTPSAPRACDRRASARDNGRTQGPRLRQTRGRYRDETDSCPRGYE
jgi:hypothetical protein